MPEGPEVEHTARVLARWLRGRRVAGVVAPPTRVLRGTRVAAVRRVAGTRLAGVARVGKFLLLRFEGGAGLLVHLGMSGHFVRRRPGEARAKHVRLALRLDDGSEVCFVDPRMFGRVAAHPAEALAALPEVARHGPDALAGPLDGRILGARVGRTRRAIKVALLDPAVVAGVGNIQATEALWRAKIDPRRPGHSLTAREIGALAKALRASLRDTLATLNGDAMEYVNAGGGNPFPIYDREGEPCPRCRRPLARIVQAARTTTWCPHC